MRGSVTGSELPAADPAQPSKHLAAHPAVFLQPTSAYLEICNIKSWGGRSNDYPQQWWTLHERVWAAAHL